MTFDSDLLSEEARWQYYVASYTMTDATEGVDLSRMAFPFLRRNITEPHADVDKAYDEVYGQLHHSDHQTVSISPDNYKIRLDHDWQFWRPVPGTTDVQLRNGTTRRKVMKEYTYGKIEENEAFREKFVRNTAWMKDQPAEDVERRKAAWERGVKESMMGFDEQVAELERAASSSALKPHGGSGLAGAAAAAAT